MEIPFESDVNFQSWLQSELVQRCKRNPSYSLRSMANQIDIDSSSLSQIISGKRKASVKLIRKICQNLKADPRHVEFFVKYAEKRKSRLATVKAEQHYKLMSEDTLSVISIWYHYAIMELISVKQFQNNIFWIAKSLSISVSEAAMAVERLLRLNLIKEENGVLSKTEEFVTSYTPGKTTEAKKELQRQVLKLGLKAIDDVPLEKRNMTSMTMAINVDKLPEAVELITQFRRQLCAFMSDDKRSVVYQLGVQFYPISKPVQD
jgi:uncharacterized protein (TIGR02147 family)